MANQKLLEVFLNTKRILCKNDYYIHIPKKIIRVTNTENMIPHLMGMQYVGRPDMFTGARGAYWTCRFLGWRLCWRNCRLYGRL